MNWALVAGLAFLLILATSGWAVASKAAEPLITNQYGGANRSYLAQAPVASPAADGFPVVIGLHGGSIMHRLFSSAGQARRSTRAALSSTPSCPCPPLGRRSRSDNAA